MGVTTDRSEIDAEYKWDLSRIYPDQDAWAADVEAAETKLADLEQYRGTVAESGERLLAVLSLRDEIMRTVDTVSTYARMRADEDLRDQDHQQLKSRAQSLNSRTERAASFIEPEIQAAGRDSIEGMVARTDGLETYTHYLDDVFRRAPHIRSAEVEELLADLEDVHETAGDIYTLFTNTDMEYPVIEHPDGHEVQLGRSNFLGFLREHPDRDFRRRVHESFYEAFGDVRTTVSALFDKSVRKDVTLARQRGYDSAREAALDEENVPVAVYDTLLETVYDTLEPHHRHLELKREALGVDELRMWDVFMPIPKTASPTIPYDQAKTYVIEALGQLGEAYQERVAEGLDSRWVDVYPSAGKLGGIDYSAGSYDTEPYLLLNYTDNIPSMTVMAHELGHSMHSDLANRTQPYVYSDYGKFVAEIASMVNEGLLTHHLLDTVEDPDLRRHVVNGYLERFRRMLYGQALGADFDHRIHTRVADGEALTPDALDALYRDLKKEFYAPVAFDPYIDREWMRTPHYFFTYSLYQYATGMSAATQIVRMIREEGQPAAERYLEFLRKGSEEYPLDRLAAVGVDMTSAEPIARTLSVYDEYVDEMASLMT